MLHVSNASVSDICQPVREAMKVDALSDQETHDVHNLYHAVRQVQSSSVDVPCVNLSQKNTGFVSKFIWQSAYVFASFWPGSGGRKDTCGAPLEAASLAIQHSAGAGAIDLAQDAASSWWTSFIHDPLVFPGAAANPAYADHAPAMAECDAHFFAFDSREGKAFLASLNGDDVSNDDAGGNAAAMQEHLANKELMLVFVPHVISKRVALGQAPQGVMDPGMEDAERQQDSGGCKIRTKTNEGTVIGDSILVAGEYVRNPVRGALEKIKEELLPGQPMTEAEVTMAEMGNLAQDVVFGFFTAATYPILKYGAAKALNMAGNGINGDLHCIKREFSGDEMAQLLFNTEIGMTDRRAWTQTLSADLSKATASFKPRGLFVQEHVPSGVHTEKYMTIQRDGEEIMIRQKAPDEYVTYHPHASHPDRLEQRVFFDQKTQRIFFDRHFPEGQGYDYEIIDGRKYIEVQRQNHELVYNWKTRRPEIKIEIEDKTEILPVYMEKISHLWHLGVQDGKPVFTPRQVSIIQRIKIKDDATYFFHPVDNLNPDKYGNGKIYEIRKKNEPLSNPTKDKAVEMNGSLVPVREIVVKEHGVRYEIFRQSTPRRRGHHIEWDGRWKFKSRTSPRESRKSAGPSDVKVAAAQQEGRYAEQKHAGRLAENGMASAVDAGAVRLSERELPGASSALVARRDGSRAAKLAKEVRTELSKQEEAMQGTGRAKSAAEAAAKGFSGSARSEAASRIQGAWRRWQGIVAERKAHAAAGQRFVQTTYPHQDPSTLNAASSKSDILGMINFTPVDGGGPTLSRYRELGNLVAEGSRTKVLEGPRGSVLKIGVHGRDILWPTGLDPVRYADLKSFSPVVRIDEKQFIARNAGRDLNKYLWEENGILQVSEFKQASQDLMQLHKRNLYHLDIKTKNMAYKAGGTEEGAIFFLDCERITDNLGTGGYPTFSRTALSPTPDQAIPITGKADDEYAFLLVLMEAADITFEMVYSDLNEFADASTREELRIHSENFVQKYVKPAHRDDVLAFINEPTEAHALVLPLHEMIDWDAPPSIVNAFQWRNPEAIKKWGQVALDADVTQEQRLACLLARDHMGTPSIRHMDRNDDIRVVSPWLDLVVQLPLNEQRMLLNQINQLVPPRTLPKRGKAS